MNGASHRKTREREWRWGTQLEAIPATQLAQLVPPDRRAVVIAPHPDDEVLGTGGLLASLALLGRPALVIVVTDGTASHPGSRTLSAHALEQMRPAETKRAVLALGHDMPIVRLRFPDGDVQHHIPALARRCAALLLPDDVLFSPWSADGHPDHEATALAVARLCREGRHLHFQVPIWAWHWRRPDDGAMPWHRACRLELAAAAMRRKQVALASFRTQRCILGSRPAIVSTAMAAHFERPFEVYFG